MPGAARPTTQFAPTASAPAPAEAVAENPRQKRAPQGVDCNRAANEILSLNALLRDNAQLRRQLRAARDENAALSAEKARETGRLGLRIAELRLELAGHQAAAARLTGQLHSLQESLPELRERQNLARRASDAEARASALSARLAEQESSAEQWQRRYQQLLEQCTSDSAATESITLR